MDELCLRFVNCPADTKEPIYCPAGVRADTLLSHFGIQEHEIAAVRVNNEILPLNIRLEVNAVLEPVLLDSPEGLMIYRRSLAFLLAIAARELFPERNLYIGHSLGNGYYYTFTTGKKPEEEEIRNLKKIMERLVRENHPIILRYAAYNEALEIFKKNNQIATSRILEHRSESRIKINECKGYADIFIEPLVRRTGLLSAFDLQSYEEGFLLRFPGAGRGQDIDPFENCPGIFSVYREYKKWGRIVGVRSVGELNARISDRSIRDYIRIAEAFQGRKLVEIAEKIYEKRDTLKMILIAGPSSSGKTTSAKRLAIELMVMGIKPLAISLDDYYVGTDKTPRDEKGEPDYECLEALDVPYLNRQLLELLAGEEITLPVFNFKAGKRKETGGQEDQHGPADHTDR